MAEETNDEYLYFKYPCYVLEKDAKNSVNIVLKQLQRAFIFAESYRDLFGKKLHSYDSFLDLIKEWEDSEWLKTIEMPEVIFPKDKKYMEKLREQQIVELMVNLEDTLKNIFSTLQVVAGGMGTLLKLAKENDEDYELVTKITDTVSDIRVIICLFKNYLLKCVTAPTLISRTVYEFIVNSITPENYLVQSLLVYRDTLNYLEFVVQVLESIRDDERYANRLPLCLNNENDLSKK